MTVTQKKPWTIQQNALDALRTVAKLRSKFTSNPVEFARLLEESCKPRDLDMLRESIATEQEFLAKLHAALRATVTQP